MPFVHGGSLYMTHSVVPHRVFRVNSQGVAVQQFVTANAALFRPFEGQDVHGGPPVVRVDGPLLPAGAEPYLLGVFHFFIVRAWLPFFGGGGSCVCVCVCGGGGGRPFESCCGGRWRLEGVGG